MIKKHYPALFAADDPWRARAEAVAAKTHELVSFLTDVLGVIMVEAAYPGTVTYHDSCSGLRELKIREQPRLLLHSVSGLALKEMADANVCCGFGGTFCVKYPDVSNAMVAEKTGKIADSGADTVLAGDLGCLMNIAGKLQRDGTMGAGGEAVKVRHIAEVLAGMAEGLAIGEAE
jgi:L-lactate dehydrogenase complex protein LldE